MIESCLHIIVSLYYILNFHLHRISKYQIIQKIYFQVNILSSERIDISTGPNIKTNITKHSIQDQTAQDSCNTLIKEG